MPIDYSDYSDAMLEEEYVRVIKCKKCHGNIPGIELEFKSRDYLAREIRNVRQLARS